MSIALEGVGVKSKSLFLCRFSEMVVIVVGYLFLDQIE
jgi:hypothetical protein